MIDIELTEIIYALPQGQEINVPPEIKNDEKIKFHKGIPAMELFSDGSPRLLVIDDQASQAGEECSELFTRLSHHYNISVMLLSQNIFLSTPHFRTMSLNSHYIILFKSPRSMDQIACISRQICPFNSKFIQASYFDCCQKAFSYLLLDFTQQCPEKLRYRTNIFPDDENCTTCYIPTQPPKPRSSKKNYK